MYTNQSQGRNDIIYQFVGFQNLISPFPTLNESKILSEVQNLPNVIEIRRDNSVMMFLGGWRT